MSRRLVRVLPAPRAGAIPTKDAAGNPNGYVLPLWNALEQPDERPDQVYVTAIAPHSRKGPHLHKKRCGRFQCIKGNVCVTTREPAPALGIPIDDRDVIQPIFDSIFRANGKETGKILTGIIRRRFSGEDHEFRRVKVEPGVPCALYNDGDTEALVINMPTPAWSKEDPDEWPVEGWID